MFAIQTKEPLEISKAEVFALADAYGSDVTNILDRVVVIDKPIPFHRLSLSKCAVRVLTETELETEEFEDFRVVGPRKKELELGEKLKGTPNLRAPKTIIRVFENGLVGVEVWKFEQKQYERKLPVKHHLSLRPELCRLLLNFARVKEGDLVYDPFCGMGSVLVEAGMLGARVIGSDIDKKMYYGCAANLKANGITGEVFQADIKDVFLDGEVDAIATDLPYGHRSSLHKKDKDELYEIALDKFPQFLRLGGYASVIAAQPLATEALALADYFKIRVHGSLDRHVHVFRRI